MHRDRFGFRNSPTAMYSRFSPPLRLDRTTQRMAGGLFWDGRAGTLEAQAAQPLLNPIEMNNPSKERVAEKVRRASYARGFRDVYGANALADAEAAFANVGRALAAYERTPPFAPFSSRYDQYLAGTETLPAQELRGLAIFEDPARGNCAGCHPSRPGRPGGRRCSPTSPTRTSACRAGATASTCRLPPELNPEGEAFVDRGLGKTTGDPRHDGKFKAPTLRNVARTYPYGHNGYFQTLREVVEFLATRAIAPCGKTADPACTAPEVPANVEPWVGHLPLTDGRHRGSPRVPADADRRAQPDLSLGARRAVARRRPVELRA